MTTTSRVLILLSLALWPGLVSSQSPVSEETTECVDCHISVTPGIVKDWQTSRHAGTTLASALKKSRLERRVSAESIPLEYRDHTVGCYECHSQNGADHTDNFEHFGYDINVIVTPNDCRTCHAQEVAQYTPSKKGQALDNLRNNPIYQLLVNDITRLKEVTKAGVVPSHISEHNKGQSCYACHGTEVKVEGTLTIETEFDDIEVPNLTNWPNQGVGRINPDGSKGACTACHPRHSFAIEIARKPYTCGQCHLEPDVPAYNVYKESKHGNIIYSKGAAMDFKRVPWRVGEDFQAPTCATCHNSLLTTPDGKVLAERSHDFGARLWVRIFGLPYTHAQPKEGGTWTISNADDLPLPTTFAGVPASEFLIDAKEQSIRRGRMKGVCTGCHATSWADKFLTRIDSTNANVDRMILAATQLLQQAWDRKVEDPADPFDETLEMMWLRQWVFYANSVRYATAMSGPDYAAFKNGWFDLAENLRAMETELRVRAKKKVFRR
ncbi:MAG: hydroxylamine oxidase [Fidelibacterota bacterium]|nr:MAG: hydroxylamine oxidase [Candidatus Neomarinimicrobiota bacterium]